MGWGVGGHLCMIAGKVCTHPSFVMFSPLFFVPERSKLAHPATLGSKPGAPWPHPIAVVSVPNVAFWPEFTRKLLDGTWDYADHGV